MSSFNTMALRQNASSPTGEIGVSRPKRSREIENPLKMDKAYRRFSASIERALSLFDIQEWADYISFLGKLHKVSRALSVLVPHATAD